MLDASFLQAEDSDPHVSLAVGGVSIVDGPPPDYGDLLSAFADQGASYPALHPGAAYSPVRHRCTGMGG